MTLLYVPLLYRWYKDAKIDRFPKLALLISILAFLFVDIEGNILFIPEIRWIFHRNDLIVAHAHVAMGIGVFFMVIAMFVEYLKSLQKTLFYSFYLIGLIGIFTVLSLSGFIQAGVFEGEIQNFWLLRSLFGLVTFLSILSFINLKMQLSLLQKYNLFGFLSDGLGGVFLLLLGSFLYPFLGFSFHGSYEYIVFAFVSMTGLIHLLSLIYKEHELFLTKLTVFIRVFISSIFFALYMNQTLEIVALLISLFDISVVLIYLLYFYKKEQLCKK